MDVGGSKFVYCSEYLWSKDKFLKGTRRSKARKFPMQNLSPAFRCSPRFLRKTRETLQREHRERITKEQYEPKEGPDNDCGDGREDAEALYTDGHQICVRPGCGARKAAEKLSKVSVAVDATPAARTDSILNQIPIELTRTGSSSEYLDLFEEGGPMLGASEYCEPTDFHTVKAEANQLHRVRQTIHYYASFHPLLCFSTLLS